MPELPDIVLLAQSMNQALFDRVIFDSVIHQPKVLNTSVQSFRRVIKGRPFQRIWQRGKWVLSELENSWILALNLGMGGEVRLHHPIEVHNPEKERVVLYLEDGNQLWVHFWWFGYLHLIRPGKLSQHPQLGTLGPEPLSEEFTLEKLASMLEGKRGRIKSYLLDQRFIAGIGNVYVQDILWHAGLHPNRKSNTLKSADIEKLHDAIQHVLQEGIRWGPGPGEQDVWGNRGLWGKREGWPYIGYRTGEGCPTCGTTIEELRVGSTTSYICPKCQV
ncbi:MAG: Fpg/Nei family DNA glycosylase [Candidatus Hodarchaeota archaeon]